MWYALLVMAASMASMRGMTTSSPVVSEHLEAADELAASGRYREALSRYHAAVLAEPANAATYVKRSGAYLAMGNMVNCLNDLNHALSLNPYLVSAKLQRGHVYLKQARLDEALLDLKSVLQQEPNNEKAFTWCKDAERTRREMEKGSMSYDMGDYKAAVVLFTQAMEVCPWSTWLREMRANCYRALSDLRSAISDMRFNTKLEPTNTERFLNLSLLYYQTGDVKNSVKEIRECLRLDLEHQVCFDLYKKFKTVDELLLAIQSDIHALRFSDCIKKANRILELDSSEDAIVFHAKEALCHCYLYSNVFPSAIASCKDALRIKTSVDVLCNCAEAHIHMNKPKEAVNHYKQALRMDRNNQKAKDGIHQVLRSMYTGYDDDDNDSAWFDYNFSRISRRDTQNHKDYYKILGVSRSATKEDIMRAYRREAKKWHPDNYMGKAKESAQKRFIDIAAAKEVLTDRKKRAILDRGGDPLEAEAVNPRQGTHTYGPFRIRYYF